MIVKNTRKVINALVNQSIIILQTCIRLSVHASTHTCMHIFFCILTTSLLQLLIYSSAISISGKSLMNAASVFDYLDPQEHMFAPNQPWQQPQTQQHMQRNQLLCPSFAVSGYMLTPISGFSPQMQHTVTSPVLQAICSDFWPEVCNDSLDSFEPVSPVYVPPISPSILIQFLMSPDYSLLQSNPVATGFSSRPFKWAGPVVLDSLDHN